MLEVQYLDFIHLCTSPCMEKGVHLILLGSPLKSGSSQLLMEKVPRYKAGSPRQICPFRSVLRTLNQDLSQHTHTSFSKDGVHPLSLSIFLRGGKEIN